VDPSEKRQIRDAVFAAAREACIFEQPSKPSLALPTDNNAERIVASALLYGSAVPSLLPCSTWDFADPLCRAVMSHAEALEQLDKLGGELDVELLTKAVARRGVPAERVRPEIVRLKWDVPVVYDLESHAERIVELAMRRRVIDLMQRLDTAWRLDESIPPQVVPMLTDALRHWDARATKLDNDD
jgi:hypothetical protein